MKKSEINPEEILKDINKAFSLLNEIEETEEIEKLDINNIQEKTNKLKEELEKKYPDYLDSKK